MNFEQFCNYVWGMYGNNTISRAWELYKKSQHALWMARAEKAKTTYENYESYFNYLNMIEHLKDDSWDGSKVDDQHWFNSWDWVERKCLEKAKEFE